MRSPHNCKGEVQGPKVILGDLSPSWPDLRRDRFPALPRGGEGAPRNSHPSPFLLSRESLNSSLRIPGRVLSPEERPGDQSRMRGKMASSQGRGRRRWLRDQIVSWGTSCCVAAACLHETTSQTSPTSVSYFFSNRVSNLSPSVCPYVAFVLATRPQMKKRRMKGKVFNAQKVSWA